MQRLILSNKNKITLFSGILIAVGFLSKWTMDNMDLFIWSLIIASVLGAAPIAIQAYQALKVKVVSIDVLVTIAVAGAFIIQNYEESAIVTFLFLFGAFLEQRTLNKTRSAIKELTEMAPESALKQMENGEFEEVEVDEVDVGDVLLVKTGAKVPVDGTVLTGEGSINEASITGESLPVGKEKGSNVFAGTILDNGTIQIVADRVGEDTTFGKIIELVEEAQDSKSEAERFIDRFSKYYTPAVLVLGFIVWLLSKDFELAITILVLGCPGALVIGVPVSNVAGIGNGARHGVLLKGSEVISDFSRLDTMVFDKTGTLTVGNPSVAVKEYYGDDLEEALGYLASVERESDHPLAKAVLEEIGETTFSPVENTEVVKGGGIVANVNGRRLAVGNVALMERENVELNEKAKADINGFQNSGNS
ncbi:MAG: HAD-IC family P-type ATPase, partial [Bacteroidales bacterium]|nr:HAD-IC family P-type ATPase [Bacteroidales bacterium]